MISELESKVFLSLSPTQAGNAKSGVPFSPKNLSSFHLHCLVRTLKRAAKCGYTSFNQTPRKSIELTELHKAVDGVPNCLSDPEGGVGFKE